MLASKTLSDAQYSSNNNGVNTSFIEPKLKERQSGDKFELEADNTADTIIESSTQPDSFLNTSFFPSSDSNILQIQPEVNPDEQDELQEQSIVAVNGISQEFSSSDELSDGLCADCEREEEESELGLSAEIENIPFGDMINKYPLDILSVTDPITDLGCDDGRDINNNGDHDLDKDIHHPDDRSPDIWIYDTILGESGAFSDFQIGFFAGTFGVDTTDDNRLFDNFTSGSGSQIHFGTGSDMAREIGSTDAFTSFAREFETSIRVYFDEHQTLAGFDCQAELIRTRPNYVGGLDSLFSWAVMGGYQRLAVEIDASSGNLDVTYRVFDHYGAGVSDAWSYLPGLSAMYYLQHYVTNSENTYVPFIWSVQISRFSSL
ncbi:hypothetical protein [Saccharicrinis sp. 156]|uniref:hypothetical protein n=1 Tax=Saccharicrinis sp. 156 TaxID=3417574 RepID=UPI003D34E240